MSFKPHIEAAHKLWKDNVKPGDCVIDATCGNGHDTLVLAKLALKPDAGQVYALDLQIEALQKTKTRLAAALIPEYYSRVHFFQGCHSIFPDEIRTNSIQLIVYNLGYLPGGDKTLTTVGEKSLISILNALRLLLFKGMICITLYPGHTEGQREACMILDYVGTLDKDAWSVQHVCWSEKKTSPRLLIIQKQKADFTL